MDLNYYDDSPSKRTKVESTDVYLAKPGQRLIGVLNGVEKDSASLEINLNNTDVLEFTLDRIVDGQVSNYYDLVERHYEVYVPKYGWFKINEEPEMSNDGNVETKVVRAESLEIELQQYDLVYFYINIGNEASREYLAIDNTYKYNDYTFFYDNVKFYRDTEWIETALAAINEMGDTIQNLQTYASEHLELLSCPRIIINTSTLAASVSSAVDYYNTHDQEDVAKGLKKKYTDITKADSTDEYKQQQYKSLTKEYQELLNYITIAVNDNGDDGVKYKASEILEREIQRQHELSLLWLVLHDHDWEVGYVDPWVSDETASVDEWDKIIIDDDKIKLADKVGMFEVSSQDVYSFITQEMAAYFRCIFVFDTVNRQVNCFNINNVGYDTNIYLSFRNIMNSVTRSSDTDLYTVFHVRGGEELDFTDANFGEDWIEDIHYFLNRKHFSKDFISKYENWEYTRDTKRPEYMKLANEYRDQLDVVSEIEDRVPIDSSDTKQYASFTDEDLVQEKANQEAMLAGYKSFFPAIEETVEPISVPSSLKVLGVGASHSRDGLRWLCKILVDAGVQNVVVGNTYIGGVSLKELYASINPSDSNYAKYEYMKCTSNDPIKRVSEENVTLQHILQDQNWDVVIFQQQGIYAGRYGSWVQEAFDINVFADYVKTTIGNPNLKMGITLHWSFGDKYSSENYEKYYGSNSRKQLEETIKVAEKVKNHMGNRCDYVVPNGLAVNYARRIESLRSIKDKLLKPDGNHLENGIPMYLVSMTYAMTLVPDINVTTVSWYPTSTDDPDIEVGATEINAMYARQCAARATGQDPYYDRTTNWEALRESIYWPNYKMIRDIVIPNIDVEILNRALDMDADDLEEDFDEDYKLDFDKYGDSYGLNELKYQLNAINNKIAVLKANGYNKKSKDGDQYHDSQYELYKTYVKAKKSCQNALDNRTEEHEEAKKELQGIKKMMNEVKEFVSKTNEQFGFTEDELKLLDKYYIHTDYENQNIATTSISTNKERVDLAYKLLLYAKDQLSAESHPQWDWSTTQDNLLLIPEFKDWYGTKTDGTDNKWQYNQLWIGNFIRVGFREDDSNRSLTVLLSEEDYQDPLLSDERDHGLVGTFVNARNEGYQAKLRVSKISINPFMMSTDIGIEFTSMVQYKYRRNDFISILEGGNSSSKNQISAGIVSNADKDNTFRVDSNLIMQLMQSGTFASYVSDIANQSGGGAAYNAVQQSISQGSMHGLVASITSETLGSSEIDVTQLKGTDEAFNELIANHIGAAQINANQIVGDFADIATIISDYIDTDFIKARIANIGHMDAESAFIKTLETEVVTTDRIIAGLAEAPDSQDYNILAGSAFIQYLNTGVINTGQITTETLIATMAQLTDAQVERLTAESALVKGVLTIGEDQITRIANGAISTATIDAEQINTQGLIAESALVRNILTIGENQITTIAEGAITTENVVASLVQAQTGDFDDLTANSAFVQYLNSGIIEAGTVSADTIIAGLASVTDEQMSKFDLLAGSAYLDYLESNLIIASEIQVNDLKAKLANITVAQIDELSTNHAFINSLQALSSSTVTSIVDDLYVREAVAGKIAVADLLAGDITISDQMRILSANGKMVMNGSALQIMGTDGQGNDYVGVQLGYATNGQPSLILRNEDGATILSPTGITSDAVADGLIVNNMIHDGTISESKLGFQVMKNGDNISIEQIYTGDGRFGAEWTEFKNGTNDVLDELRENVENVQNYFLYIETPNGTNIWGGNIQLSARLFRNNVDVTDDFDASYFTWTRTSRDHDSDTYWNYNHSQGAKIVTITANDVRMNADFQCKFEYGEITVVAD